MRVAVIADTHNRLPPAVLARIGGADEIWHLGDVCSSGIIELLKSAGTPVRVVRGNCDSCMDWPLIEDLEIEGLRIRLEHIPPADPPVKIDLLLHGHTHVPRDETRGGVRFLNPGCITRPNKGAPASFGWLTLKRGKPIEWRVELL